MHVRLQPEKERYSVLRGEEGELTSSKDLGQLPEDGTLEMDIGVNEEKEGARESMCSRENSMYKVF